MDIRQYWWFDLLTGVFTLGFGLYCFTRPDLAILTLGRLFAIFLIVFGALFGYGSFRSRTQDAYWHVFAGEGILYVALGLVLLLNPASVLTLNRILGVWFIAVGGFRFLSSRFHGGLSGYTLTGDILAILFGLFLLVYPRVFAGFIAVALGVILMLVGLVMLGNGISMWRIHKRFY